MDRTKMISELSIDSKSKIILLIIDGLGGLPLKKSGKTELESASTPHIDKLSQESVCGLLTPIYPGITPGSGQAHLALFGYDPIENMIGRGALSAAGVGFLQKADDVAIRINFATIDKKGNVTDRRAGRIPTETCAELCKLLEKNIKIPGLEIFFKPEMQHRAALIIRGKNLSDKIHDTDPQKTGVPALAPNATSPEANNTWKKVVLLLEQAEKILKDSHPANMILLRGFAKPPKIKTMNEIYKLKTAAICNYPAYRGLANLVGMDILDGGHSIKEEMESLEKNFNKYDFFYIHIKGTDSAGEDGDFDRKVKVIEEVDSYIPLIKKLNPQVLAITGDHSTPAKLKSHSWHPVPVLINAEHCRAGNCKSFSESESAQGSLGHIQAIDLMPLLMAYAERLTKFGA
jgi:2,3-bisphosphoglycerate-independent phosphoglycerate mutase